MLKLGDATLQRTNHMAKMKLVPLCWAPGQAQKM
jgi:hypothetical protein